MSSRHLLVAGGGGAANTGVKNGFEIFEIINNGENIVGESVTRYSGAHVTKKYMLQTPVSQTLHRGVQRVQPGREDGLQHQQQLTSLRDPGGGAQRVLSTLQTDS